MTHVALYRLMRLSRSKADQGSVLVLALVAALVLTLGMAALASRSSLGVFGAAFQSKNREARETAESMIAEFIDTLNQVENRYLLVGGNGNSWASADSSLLNPCTQYSSSTYLSTGPIKNLSANVSRFKVSANTSRTLGSWVNVKSGDSSSQFLVEKIEYLDDSRNPFNVTDIAKRDSIKTGNSRSLIRVTIQARVTRDGRTSYSRVARELEVVPKCCFRSFGANQYYGAYWGRDIRACTVGNPNGGGAGILAFKGTSGSKNDLNIFGEDGKEISTAICYDAPAGGDTSVVGDPSSKCGDPDPKEGLKLGSDVSLSPQQFDFLLPEFQFANSGRLPGSSGPSGDGTLWTPASSAERATLNSLYPTASPGNWVQTSSPPTVWVAGYPEKSVDPSSSSDQLLWYQTTVLNFGSSTSMAGVATTTSPSSVALTSSKDYIYYNNNPTSPNFKQVELCDLSGSTLSSCTRLPNCYTISGAAGYGPSPYAQANCTFRYLDISAKNVYVDTTNANINFVFDGNGTGAKNEYILGGGNANIINVHCATVATSSKPCTSPITWDQFKLECLSSGATADPRCSSASVTNRPYNTGELFNIYAAGTGLFQFNGSAAGVGFNLYAPNASVSLLGGGSAPANFMGRLWAGNINLTGKVNVYTLSSLPGICKSATCPKEFLPVFDMKVRSYTQASGF